MSKKTDDFITGLQIVGGVILAGTAVRHASNLIDGRLEEARYNYGNYPGPPHDRERIGDYLLSLQKQAQKDFDACAALLDARGSLPASVFEPAPAVDFTDWMVSAWENKTDFFISVFGFYDEGGQFCAAFYLRDLAGRWQLLTGVLESGWGEILLTHLVKGRPLAQIAHCLWVLAAIFGEPRYMVLARNGSLFYSKYRIAYMAAAPDRLLLEPVDLDEIFWRCLRCYGILESTAASDEKKRPFAPKNLAEPRDWQQFLTTETLTDGAVWVDFRVVGDTATAAFYARDGARHWHRVTGVAAQNWAEVLLDAAFYDLPTDIFTVWAQALTADHGTPALVTAWVMGRLMTLVTPYVVPKRLVEASEREAGEMLGLSGDALAAFENAKAKPATEIPSAAPRFASRTEQVKAGAPVWSDPKKYASAEAEEEDLFGEPEKSAVTASEIQAAFAELPQVVASIPRTVPFKEVYDDWSPSREDFSTAVLCARSPSRVLIAVTGYFRDEAHFVCRFWCGEKGDDYWRELDDLVEKGWAEVVLWYLFVKKDTAGLVKRLLKADGMVCRETLDTGRLKARAPFVVEQGGESLTLSFSPAGFLMSMATQMAAEYFACTAEDQLHALRRSQNLCRYVGSYCAKKGGSACLEKKESWCCFNSRLALVVQTEGRKQLGLGWGTPESPACRGFTLEEFQALDFSAMDLTPVIAEMASEAQKTVSADKTALRAADRVTDAAADPDAQYRELTPWNGKTATGAMGRAAW